MAVILRLDLRNVMSYEYRKVTSSHLEAHADFFRLLMEGIFDPCVL